MTFMTLTFPPRLSIAGKIIPLGLIILQIYHFQSKLGLPWCISGKESACQCRRREFDSLLGRSPGEGNGNPLQYSCLENPMDRGAWQAAVHEVAESRTRLKRLSMQSDKRPKKLNLCQDMTFSSSQDCF